MQVKVMAENADAEISLSKNPLFFFVEQANNKAILNQQSYCHLRGKIIKALVPACVPSVTSQVPQDDFEKLVLCYEECIMMAIKSKAEIVLFKPLGVGIKTTKISENGETAYAGIWGNLFWTQAKSSMAAKKATQNVCLKTDDHTSLTVIFSVPKEAYDDWDCAMQF